MQEIQFIAPAALHDEMLRLRNEKQMDFLESLTGMDWGVADEKDAPEKLRGLGVVYHLESTITGERIALKTATTNRELPEIPSVSDIWKIADFYEREVFDFMASPLSVILICAGSTCATIGSVIRCVKITIRKRITHCA